MSDFPFDKNTGEALKMARWARDEIAILHVALENSNSHETTFRLQGRIKQCRLIIGACEISAIDLAQFEEDTQEVDFNRETPPIPVD